MKNFLIIILIFLAQSMFAQSYLSLEWSTRNVRLGLDFIDDDVYRTRTVQQIINPQPIIYRQHTFYSPEYVVERIVESRIERPVIVKRSYYPTIIFNPRFRYHNGKYQTYYDGRWRNSVRRQPSNHRNCKQRRK